VDELEAAAGRGVEVGAAVEVSDEEDGGVALRGRRAPVDRERELAVERPRHEEAGLRPGRAAVGREGDPDAGARVLRDRVDGAAVAGGDRRVALRADAGGGGGAEAPAAVARAADEVGTADRRGGEPDRAVVADREGRLPAAAGRGGR